jgi:gliding motility-associated-like protein
MSKFTLQLKLTSTEVYPYDINPHSMKIFFTSICLILLASAGSAQVISNCPPNIDFEEGSLAGWDCFIGSTKDSAGLNVINLQPSPPTANRHTLISKLANPGNDLYGGFPKVCPYGGNYSVQLGNNASAKGAEGLSYTFQIPPSADTFTLTYYYAVVFQDPSHTPIQQPRFFVTAYDVVTGDLINCASFNYIATGSIPGFKVSTSDPSVLYKDWTPTSIDFSGLGGRTVRLEFKTADCTLGAHFGYAYVDVATGCGGLLGTGSYCIETNSVILNAPYGFQSYTWYNANYTAIVGTQQSITLSPPPPINSLFHVDMIPYPGYGCRDTADAILTPIPVPDTPQAQTSYFYCQFSGASQLTAIADPGNQLLWYTAPAGGVGSLTAPTPSTNSNGVFEFYVSQKQLFGCESFRRKITVTVSPTPQANFSINSLRQCQKNNSFVFTNGTTNTTVNSEYLWIFGDGDSSTLLNPAHVFANYGTYNVRLRVTNPPVCFTEKIIPVEVIADPLAQFYYPPVICGNQTSIALLDNSAVPGGPGVVSNWWWQIGSGNAFVKNPPPFFAPPGQPLLVRLAVSTAEGCRSDTINISLPVYYLPNAIIKLGPPLCSNEPVTFLDASFMPAGSAPDRVVKWSWLFDNSIADNSQNPSLMFAQGLHNAKLIAESDRGCTSAAADSQFMVYGKPAINLSISDSCVFRNILYTAGSMPGNPVSKWSWDFGNGYRPGASVVNKTFTIDGYNPLKLIGETVHGCKDTLIRPFTIYYNRTRAGNDTIVAKDEPVQLDAKGDSGTVYTWTPAIGLNNAFIRNPIATLDVDQQYVLNTFSKEGCDSRSKILIRRYKGPELYMPNAFSPNGDVVNEVLRVFPVGIKSFGYFSVFTRGGQRIFHTTDYTRGWDGTFKGAKLDPGTFVVVATAVDYKGNAMFKKGTVVLLR